MKGVNLRVRNLPVRGVLTEFQLPLLTSAHNSHGAGTSLHIKITTFINSLNNHFLVTFPVLQSINFSTSVRAYGTKPLVLKANNIHYTLYGLLTEQQPG